MFLSLTRSYPNTDILKTKILQQCSEWGPVLRLQVKLGAAGEVIWLSRSRAPWRPGQDAGLWAAGPASALYAVLHPHSPQSGGSAAA